MLLALPAMVTARKVLADRLTDAGEAFIGLLDGQADRIQHGLVPEAPMFQGDRESPVFLFAQVPGGKTYQNTGVSRTGRHTFLCQAVAKCDSPVEQFGDIASIAELSECAAGLLQSFSADEGNWRVLFSVVEEFSDEYTIDNDVFQGVGFYLDVLVGRHTE